VFKQGPLAFLTTYSIGLTARSIHNLLAIGGLVLIGGHLAGVAFESLRLRQNLTRSMVTGTKPGPVDAAEPWFRARPVMTLLVAAVMAIVAVTGTLRLSARPGLGVPVASADTGHVRECGACHFAYPPSLATAAVWTATMDGLAEHFGENASLDADQALAIRRYLVVNAAEHFDTQAAHRFRVMKPSDPLRLTATPGWTGLHRDIADAVFTNRAVGGKGACNACHQDAASARFAPQQIAIPREALN
jgi:hypothetical protein